MSKANFFIPGDVLPLEVNEQLDQICLEFEDALISGRRPSLEQQLASRPAAERDSLLFDLLHIDIAYRRQRDEAPQKNEYLRRFSAHREVVESVFRRSGSVSGSTALYEPGTRLERYTIERLLGQGGFGAVYLAFDDQLQRRVAVKTTTPNRFMTDEDEDRLAEEARTVAALQHPGIAAVYDVGRDDAGRIFVVFQYVDGFSLRERLAADTLPPAEAVELFAAIATAADYAHQRGFVHRDLEPGNILLDRRGRPVVTDFGLALHESLRADARGQVAGSLPYMSPEQWRGESERLDGRTDIWAIGVMLFEALTGRRPFRGDDERGWREAVLQETPPPLRSLDDSLPAELEAICQKCLNKAPERRFNTAADLARAPCACQTGLRPRRRTALAALASTAFLAALALLALGTARPAPRPLPLRGELQLLVWREEQWRPVDESGGLPLRSGDLLRVEISANQSAHLYLLWVDGKGKVWPAFPWRGDWRQAAGSALRQRLSLPDEDPTSRWVMEAESNGLETLVLLARRTALPNAAPLRQLLAGLPPQPYRTLSAPARFRNGRPLADIRDRAPDFSAKGHIRDDMLNTQRELFRRLRPHFDCVQTLVVPTVAGPSSDPPPPPAPRGATL